MLNVAFFALVASSGNPSVCNPPSPVDFLLANDQETGTISLLARRIGLRRRATRAPSQWLYSGKGSDRFRAFSLPAGSLEATNAFLGPPTGADTPQRRRRSAAETQHSTAVPTHYPDEPPFVCCDIHKKQMMKAAPAGDVVWTCPAELVPEFLNWVKVSPEFLISTPLSPYGFPRAPVVHLEPGPPVLRSWWRMCSSSFSVTPCTPSELLVRPCVSSAGARPSSSTTKNVRARRLGLLLIRPTS